MAINPCGLYLNQSVFISKLFEVKQQLLKYIHLSYSQNKHTAPFDLIILIYFLSKLKKKEQIINMHMSLINKNNNNKIKSIIVFESN
jgi:hypothetical protein